MDNGAFICTTASADSYSLALWHFPRSQNLFIEAYVATENLSLGDFATENRFVCRRQRWWWWRWFLKVTSSWRPPLHHHSPSKPVFLRNFICAKLCNAEKRDENESWMRRDATSIYAASSAFFATLMNEENIAQHLDAFHLILIKSFNIANFARYATLHSLFQQLHCLTRISIKFANGTCGGCARWGCKSNDVENV